jgi:hypothetical protein
MAVMGITALDRLEIGELLARYAAAVDEGDFDGVGDLFAEAELLDPRGAVVAAGRAAVTALFSATTLRHDEGTPETVHLVTNVVVDADPELPSAAGAVVRSRFVVLQEVAAGRLEPVAAGRYRDRVERVGGAWRFRSRQMFPELWGDVSRHLAFDPRTVEG